MEVLAFCLKLLNLTSTADSTAQFIHGYTSGNEEEGVHEEGLQCVVIIIGVYSKTDGLPIIGVCNQPFCNLDSVTNR